MIPILGASDREEWTSYLADFQAQVYPLFRPYGVTFAEALTIWTLNRARRELEMLNEDRSDDEPWKSGDDDEDDDA